MSTNIFDHGFGIVGYRYKCTSYQEGDLVSTIEKDRTSLRCPCCKSAEVTKRSALPRWFKTVSIDSKRVFIKLYRFTRHLRTFAENRRFITPVFAKSTLV